MDAKKFMSCSCHDKVVKWDDSAGAEAFKKAKNRFYAKLHDIPCEIQMPDPNLYVDQVDWNCVIDPELIQDLDQVRPTPDMKSKKYEDIVARDNYEAKLKAGLNAYAQKKENSRKYNSYRQNNKHLAGSGWANYGNNSWGWSGDNGTGMVGNGWGISGWQGNGIVADGWRNSGWENGWNCWWGWFDQYGYANVPEYVHDPGNLYGTSYTEGGNRSEDALRSNEYQRNEWRSNATCSRGNFVSEGRMAHERNLKKSVIKKQAFGKKSARTTEAV